MNPVLKNILIISLKQAVNAVMTTAGLMTLMKPYFHMHSWDGILHIVEALGSVIVSREAMVWGPKLLAWSQKDATPNGGPH